MTLPCIGVIQRPLPPVTYVIADDSRGGYVERNRALDTWRFTSLSQYAQRFQTREEAAATIPEVIAELGDVWHVTAADLRILERHS